MVDLYRTRSHVPRANAQRNLMGRTHYVDDDTLHYYKSRVISANAVCNGFVFALITSDALDLHNTKRGFRYVVFDIFGYVIGRTELDDAYRTSGHARQALWTAINALDVKALTLAAVERERELAERELAELATKAQNI